MRLNLNEGSGIHLIDAPVHGCYDHANRRRAQNFEHPLGRSRLCEILAEERFREQHVQALDRKGWAMIKIRDVCPKLFRAAEELKRNCDGQDLVEYSLMAGFIVCAVVTMAPQIADSFVVVMSKVNSVVVVAGN